MKFEIQDLSDIERQEKIQELTEGLLMPTGELAVALLAAAILVLIFLWKTSGLT
jgi:hypothetical protein